MAWTVRLGLVLAIILLAMTSASAQGTRRVALVIANGAYRDVPPLANPLVDARLVGQALRGAGFEVLIKSNLDHSEFNAALSAYAQRAAGAEIAIIYFSGHGVEDNSTGWLLPIDARASSRSELATRSVSLDRFSKATQGAQLRLVVVDACRSTPFPLTDAYGRLVVNESALFFGEARALQNEVLILSASSRTDANDGEVRIGSPFARAFARHVSVAGAPLRHVTARIAHDVFAETGGQLPFAAAGPGVGRDALLTGTAPVTVPELGGSLPSSVLTSNTGQAVRYFRDCSGCPEMVLVPGGAFVMGSPDDEIGREVHEGPPRPVRVAPFAAGQYEVTEGDWNACIASSGCPRIATRIGSRSNRSPAVEVSWQDAQAYVRWLSRITQRPYRLLTEAEWEYAARAATATAFATGATLSTAQANIDNSLWGGGGMVASQPSSSGLDDTNYNVRQISELRPNLGGVRDVGSYPANTFGLHDMHGNVWELVEDCFADAEAADSGQRCAFRVMRGGSWASAPEHARSASRIKVLPTARNRQVGFRIARDM